jgi:hypothetical protein
MSSWRPSSTQTLWTCILAPSSWNRERRVLQQPQRHVPAICRNVLAEEVAVEEWRRRLGLEMESWKVIELGLELKKNELQLLRPAALTCIQGACLGAPLLNSMPLALRIFNGGTSCA